MGGYDAPWSAQWNWGWWWPAASGGYKKKKPPPAYHWCSACGQDWAYESKLHKRTCGACGIPFKGGEEGGGARAEAAPAEMAVDEGHKNERGGNEPTEVQREVKVVSAHRALEAAERKLEKATKLLLWHQDSLEEAKEQHVIATERLQDAKATWNKAVAANKKQSSMEKLEESLAAEDDWPEQLRDTIRNCLGEVAKQRELDAAARRAEAEEEERLREEARQEAQEEQGGENLEANEFEEYVNAVWREERAFGDEILPGAAGTKEDSRGRSRSPIREEVAAGKGKSKGTARNNKNDTADSQQSERSESEKRELEERIKRTMAASEEEVAKRKRLRGKASP